MSRFLKWLLPGLIGPGIICLLCLCPGAAHGDQTFQLLDKTKIVGKFLHYYEGVISIQLPNGTKMQLPDSKVRQIKFKMPKARKAFSSPSKTFKRMKKMAHKGDLEGYIDCHSAYYQMFLGQQISMLTPAKFKKRLKKEWGSVKLKIVKTSIKGGTAVMKVRRQGGDDKSEGELRFVLENNEWKMILPL